MNERIEDKEEKETKKQIPKEQKKEMWKTVLRIRDVYPGSRILIFTHPGSRISDPGSKNSKKREG
jgi:hypothetical protein